MGVIVGAGRVSSRVARKARRTAAAASAERERLVGMGFPDAAVGVAGGAFEQTAQVLRVGEFSRNLP
jgi:hypothetical protein